MISSSTKLYISGSQAPGDFGATVFNELFHREDIDAVYLPRRFANGSLLLDCAKNMDIAGFAVSSPMKREIVPLLDEVDELSRITGAVNTVKQVAGRWLGFNTDGIGFQTALKEDFGGAARSTGGTRARIVGAGGVVSTLVHALRELKYTDIEILARDVSKAQRQLPGLGVRFRAIAEQVDWETDLLVNAVSDETFWSHASKSTFGHAALAFDLRATKIETPFCKLANRHADQVIRGFEMATYQLEAQFQIYFQRNLRRDELRNIVQEKYLCSR